MFIQKGIISESLIKSPIWGRSGTNSTLVRRIKFPSAYKQPPFIQLSVERIDSGAFIEPSSFKLKGSNLLHTVTRYDISAQDVSGSEFTLKVSTWNDNVIYGFRISWIAFGEKAPEAKPTNDQLAEILLQYIQKEKEQYDNDRH